MRLNPDCIRDILLTVEEETGYNKHMGYGDGADFVRLAKYPTDEVKYHLKQCEYSGFFVGFQQFLGGGFMIRDLSPMGHEFIADIRTDTNWNKVKEIAKQAGSFSIEALSRIATGVIAEVIKSHF